MRSHVAIAWLVAAIPAAAAAAEDQPGIDLSQRPKAEPPEKADGEELPPIDLSKPPPPPAREAPAAPAERPGPVLPFSEKDVALGDKVKAVQRKGFLKKGRLELAPIFAATVNDAFYQKFGYGLRLAYNLHDAFAVAVRGTKYAKLRTDNVREGKLAFQSQLLTSDIDQQVMLGGVWSPVYGKASVLQSSIIHFDLFLQAGFGLVWSATSGPPLSQGPHVAADFGGGLRFYPKEWLAFELGLLATLYPDQPVAQLPATTQRVFVFNVGMSFFWPFTFDYVYP
ncbi:MAG TPA: outer membrane beta-barrel domain-containing protein [Anaeromyxobacter sp.]